MAAASAGCKQFDHQKLNGRQLFKRQLLRRLPHRCRLCGGAARGIGLCPHCRADLPWLPAPRCPICALPSEDGQICGACLSHPPAWQCTRSALHYDFPVDGLVGALKYRGDLSLAPLLADCLAGVLEGAAVDAILPLPLHPARLAARGYNQAMELARPLARRFHLPLVHAAVQRVRDTPPQAGLDRAARLKNLRGAFLARPELVSGLRIAVLDDVMTSGATLGELTRTLKQAGAVAVECWVVARALPPGQT